MNILNTVVWPRVAVHNTRREGIRLGLIVATVTWLWIALVDGIAGRPFHTFTALGGILPFTAVHYVLNVIYGMVLLSIVHGAKRAPSLMFVLLFGIILFEGAAGMFTNIFVERSLGNAAWIGMFGGSLINAAIVMVLLSRTHPLAAYLRRAEEES
jgi:hypothetical protein